MYRVLVVGIAVASAACGLPLFDGEEPDAPTRRQRCEQIVADWRAAVLALDRACVTASDCVVLEDDAGNCEGGNPTLGGCMGLAVNAAAYEAHRDDIAGKAIGFGDCTCEDVDSLCASDCGGGVAECRDGQCSSRQSDFCWMDRYDAAP